MKSIKIVTPFSFLHRTVKLCRVDLGTDHSELNILYKAQSTMSGDIRVRPFT